MERALDVHQRRRAGGRESDGVVLLHLSLWAYSSPTYSSTIYTMQTDTDVRIYVYITIHGGHVV